MKVSFFVLIALLLLIFPNIIYAKSGSECSDRFVTIVNPVRSRSFWYDKSLKPLNDQYQAIQFNGLKSTWLLQHDTLSDIELISQTKKFDNKHEKGVFLEISKTLADESRVVYPYDAAWFSPRAIFLSGYRPSDRRRLIDRIFYRYKQTFGIYPKSVGAWWIDAYSLDYMQSKYNITSVLIVADQLSTDGYGVWGQWWGVPYSPSKANTLIPASSKSNKQDIVILQWAQRDLLKSYGDTPLFSNYSLQANDYIRQGETTSYFKKLSSRYLDCKNPVGQITVGLETGIEGSEYINEYRNQMKYLGSLKNLESVTLSEFAQKYQAMFSEQPAQKVVLGEKDGQWILTTFGRINSKLKDEIVYDHNITFSDYFIADKSDFLNRNLNILKDVNHKVQYPWAILTILLILLWSNIRNKLAISALALFFSLNCFGLILRSFYKFGWQVNFGPDLQNLEYIKLGVLLLPLGIILLLNKFIKSERLFWILIWINLSFGFDVLIKSLRYSFISGTHYLGLGLDNLRVIGISFKKSIEIGFFNQDFPGFLAVAFLRIDYSKLWSNYLLTFVLYPMVHILAGLALFFLVYRFNLKIKYGILIVLGLLLLLNLIMIVTQDPISVTST